MENYTKTQLLKMLWAKERESPVASVKQAQDLLPIFAKWQNKKQEHFLVATLNTRNQLIKVRVITKGILDQAMAHPREIFRSAITDNASTIVLCHNHPSGDPQPSIEDNAITKRIRHAGKIIGIHVLDHIIISATGYYSYEANGV